MPSASAEENQIGFNAFIPTAHYNSVPGRVDPYTMEFHNLRHTDLSNVLDLSKEILPTFDAKKPPKLIIYLSKKRSAAEQKEMVEKATEEIQKKYPHLPLKVETRYIQNEIELEEASKQIDEAIESAASSSPNDAETEAAKKVLHEANQEALKDAKAFENNLPSYLDPANTNKFIEYSAQTNGMLSGVQRTLQLYLSGVQGSPAAVSSAISLVFGDAGYNYLITKYENLVGKWQSEHPLPYAKRLGLDRLNTIYKESQVARLIKATVTNIPIFSIGVSGLQQMGAHFANPEVNGAYTSVDISRNVNLGLLWAGIYFGGFVGAEKLKQKGQSNQAATDLYRKALGLIYTVNGAVATSGRPEILEFLPYTIGPLWAFTLLPGAVNLTRSTRNDRIILVDNKIDNRNHLNQLENLESTHIHTLDKNDMDSKIPEIKKQKLIKKSVFEIAGSYLSDTAKNSYQLVKKSCSVLRKIASNN